MAARTPDPHQEAVLALRKQDRALARIISRVGPCGLVINRRGTHFEALCSSITSQQVTGAAARTIFGRVRALGERGRFPSPARVLELGPESLRTAGLSRQKIAALLDLSEKIESGALALGGLARLPDEAVIERLTTVRGIGRWTAEMILLFRLGRPDILAATDLGIQKGILVVDQRDSLPTPKEVLSRGERWAPWRSVASWYLWRASELT